jgi:lantibiotic modifying enzyme
MVAGSTTVLAMPSGEAAESLALGALKWLLGSARSTEAGLTWAATVPGAEANFSLYHGAAGIVLAFLEARQHFGDDRYGDAAMRAAAAISAAVDYEASCSLYFGLAGMAVALHAVHVQLGDSAAGAAARRALDQVRARFDGERWGVMFELLGGNAGVALGALHADDPELAVLAGEPYLRTADPTPGGVNWAVRPSPARSHHIAHGTLGIAYALAAAGTAVGRSDLVELALCGDPLRPAGPDPARVLGQ